MKNNNQSEITWETQIKNLMSEFKLSSRSNDIISSVKASSDGTESDALLYDRAWRKFRDLLFA